jgi:hypothetical protein
MTRATRACGSGVALCTHGIRDASRVRGARRGAYGQSNRICIVLLLAALAAAPLWADGSLFGTIAGKTRDESGGALPGVTVR